MGKILKIGGSGRGIGSGLILAVAVVAFTAVGNGPRTVNTGSGEPAEITVSYDELNLESEAGAEALLRRIERAASKVCGSASRPVELWKHSPFRECVSGAMERAVYSVNAPLVSDLYERNKRGEYAKRQQVSQE